MKLMIITAKLLLVLLCFSRIQELTCVFGKLAVYVCGCFIFAKCTSICVHLSSIFDNLVFDA